MRSTALSYQWRSVYCSVVKIKAVEVKCGSLTWFISAVCRRPLMCAAVYSVKAGDAVTDALDRGNNLFQHLLFIDDKPF